MFSELLSDLRYRLRALFRRAELERELSDEIQDHLEREAAANRVAGMSPDDAMRQARRAFGGVEQAREGSRDVRGVRWIEVAVRDVQLALRTLRGQPAFSMIAILSLAIGITMSAGIVTVLRSIYGGGLAFGNAGDIVALYQPVPNGRNFLFLPATLRSVTTRATQLSRIALYADELAIIRTDTLDAHIAATVTTPSLMALLGMKPELGRTFAVADGEAGSPAVTVISHDYWISHFGGNPDALGRTLSIDGRSVTIVGVLPREMTFPSGTKLWLPRSARAMLADTGIFIHALARRSAGANPARIDAELTTIARSDSQAARVGGPLPLVRGPLPMVRAITFQAFVADQIKDLLYFLAAVGVALALIASVNFAAVVLARGMRRREELGIRAALGASTGRLVLHMLAECGLLGVAGGALGALGAPLALRGFDALVPGIIPPWLHMQWGLRAAGLAIALAVALGLIFGIAPAIELARPAAAGFLRTGTGGAIGFKRQRRGRRALVVFQVFLAIAPVVFLSILIAPDLSMQLSASGVDMRGLYSAQVGDYTGQDSVLYAPAVRARTLDVIRAVPGVEAAAIATDMYVSNSGIEVDTVGAGNFVPYDGRGGRWHGVTEQYFAAFRPRLLAGRFPSDAELSGGAPVAVVSLHTATSLAGRLRTGWRMRLGLTGSGWVSTTVVGVVADFSPYALGQPPDVEVYSPLSAIHATQRWSGTLWLRSAEHGGRVVPAVYTALHTRAPNASITDLQARSVATAQIERNIRSILFIVFLSFGIAVALAAVGIYGTIAYAAATRRKEFALRVALGAARSNIAMLVTREALIHTIVGVGLGIAGGVATVVYFAPRPDLLAAPPATVMAGSSVVMLAMLVLASIGPVRRVWRTDAATVLREDG